MITQALSNHVPLAEAPGRLPSRSKCRRDSRMARRRKFGARALSRAACGGICWLFLFGWATGFGAPLEHVLIVSLDGARSDYVLSAQSSNIQFMASHGAFSWRAQTVYPSLTLIAHAAMLTGCQPGKHGIDWNDWKPEAGFVKTSTCFELVKQSGGGTAMFVGKEKLRHIAKPGTLDKFEIVKGAAELLSTTAAAYFMTNRPALMFVHYADPDAAGHKFGWGSTQYLEAMNNCDQGIGLLRRAVLQAGLASNTLFILTADHGGHQRTHGTRDPSDMTIPWIAYSPGHVLPVAIQAEVSVCDTAATAVHALGLKVDQQWDGKALVEIFVSAKTVAVRQHYAVRVAAAGHAANRLRGLVGAPAR